MIDSMRPVCTGNAKKLYGELGKLVDVATITGTINTTINGSGDSRDVSPTFAIVTDSSYVTKSGNSLILNAGGRYVMEVTSSMTGGGSPTASSGFNINGTYTVAVVDAFGVGGESGVNILNGASKNLFSKSGKIGSFSQYGRSFTGETMNGNGKMVLDIVIEDSAKITPKAVVVENGTFSNLTVTGSFNAVLKMAV